MKEYLKKRYALTDKGARGTGLAIFYSTIKSLSYMLPVFLLMYVVQGLLKLGAFSQIYATVAYVIIAVFMLFILHKDYTTTYNETYKESANLRIHLAERMKELPLSFYSRNELTDLSQTIMKDVETVEHALSHAIPSYYGFFFSSAIFVIFLLLGNVKLGLAVILPIIGSILLIFLSGNMQKSATTKYYEQKRESSRMFQELIELSTEIKAFNLTKEKKQSAIDYANHMETTQIQSEVAQALPIGLSGIVANFALGFVLYFGLQGLATGSVNMLYFAGYLFAAARMVDSVHAFLLSYGEIMLIYAPVKKIQSIQEEALQKGAPCSFNNFDVVGEDVEFSYTEDKKVIDSISFEARQNTSTALVGPSGCGKSTLLKLVSRLYDYDGGKISVDGKEIQICHAEDLFKHISMVFQEVNLFNGTVKENIRLGDLKASDEEVLQAAKLAGCDNFVSKLPAGYDTLIGENGANLSGGERQRISIARAFLKDAEIILLDEIAASLDVENEKYIQQSLNQLLRNKTLILISHRMKSIQNVDQIIVMKEGKIEATGKHEDLLNMSETYQKLVESSKFSEEFVY